MVFCRTSRSASATASSTSRAGIAESPSREDIRTLTRSAAIACRVSSSETRDPREHVLVDGTRLEPRTGTVGEDLRDCVFAVGVEVHAGGDSVVEVRKEVELAVRKGNSRDRRRKP